MSRKKNCWGNNPIELLFQSLKLEWMRDYGYVNFIEASAAITD